MDNNSIELHTFHDQDIDNGMLIIGSPTLGNIANITTAFLVQNLELELIGAFTSDKFPPASIIQDGMPLPPVRIYAGNHVCGPNGSCDQLVIISSDLPLENDLLPNFAEEIIKFARENNIETIATIEGVNKEDMDLGAEAKVYQVATNTKAKEQISDLDAEPLENGMVSGLSGVLLFKGKIQDYPITALLAEAHKNFPDSRSAAAVLEVLNKMVPEIEMDHEPLLEQAGKIESQIKESLSQIRRDDANRSVGEATQGLYA